VSSELSLADVEYIREDFHPLGAARLLPTASYVLPDGTEMVPVDYFALVDEAGGPERLRDEFYERYRKAGGNIADLDDNWDAYLCSVFGVCLRTVTPEAIVRKAELVASIESLLEAPDEEDAHWQLRLRSDVDELDALEREFSPKYDRRRFGRPPTRDHLIVAARESHPRAFGAAVASAQRLGDFGPGR